MKTRHLILLGLALPLGISSANAGDRIFGDGLPQFLQQFDTSGDGMIDEEERQAIRDARQARHEEWVAKWDEDSDGTVSPEEIEAIRQSIRDNIEARRAERFNELAGEDGSLSLEEFSAMPGMSWLGEERVAALFDRMDADDLGGVTLDEFNARLRFHRDPDGAEPPVLPELPNWQDLLDQLRDRLRGGGGGGEEAGGEEEEAGAE